MSNKLLLTGGAGFIGSNLCELLLKKGWHVTVVDNFNDYYSPEYKRSNINEIRRTIDSQGIEPESFRVFETDIRDYGGLCKIFDEEKFDSVIHLAACAGVRPSISDPVLYTDVNINGTVNILENIKRKGIKSFVFASSSSVYGNNKKVPFEESDIVDFPISPYAATKKSGELLCHTYHHLYDINTVCLRFFTVYGPRQRPDLAIYKFTDLINRGEEIPFYGDGTTRRDYTFIDDITDGIMRALNYTLEQNDKMYEIFNIGESHTISLSRMVSAIERALGKKAKLNVLPMQPGDVMQTFADISKAKRILGYDPKTDFDQGIEIFTKWFIENRYK